MQILLILQILLQTINIAGDRPPRYGEGMVFGRRALPVSTLPKAPRDDEGMVFDFQKLIFNMPRDKCPIQNIHNPIAVDICLRRGLPKARCHKR